MSTKGEVGTIDHRYSKQGTNMGRVPTDVLGPGEFTNVTDGRGKMRVTPPFGPDHYDNDRGNEGGYHAGVGAK